MSVQSIVDAYLNSIGVLERWRFEDGPSADSDTCNGDSGSDLTYTATSGTLVDARPYKYIGMGGGKGFDSSGAQYAVDTTMPSLLNIEVGRTYLFTCKADVSAARYLATIYEASTDYLAVSLTTDGNVDCRYRNSNLNRGALTTSAPITSGQEHQIAIVVPSPLATVSVYVDGVLQAATSGGTVSSTAGTITIGAFPTPANYFDGEMYDFTILSAAATQQQLTHLARISRGTGVAQIAGYANVI